MLLRELLFFEGRTIHWKNSSMKVRVSMMSGMDQTVRIIYW